MSLFRCPVCAAPLTREARAYRCGAGHSYDIAKEGYTYLLPPNQKHSAAPGDDKGMAAARREFLSKGYYAPLLNTLCHEIAARSGPAPVILDAGCGEGYYTSGIYRRLLAEGKQPQMAGIDISKCILRAAAKRDRDIEFAVASSYHLPAADGCADLLLDCFSPLALDEFRRVLKPDGVLLISFPLCLDRPTFEDPAITAPRARREAFGQEDHVRLYGTDSRERLERYGFAVEPLVVREQMTPEEQRRMALIPDDTIFRCTIA